MCRSAGGEFGLHSAIPQSSLISSRTVSSAIRLDNLKSEFELRRMSAYESESEQRDMLNECLFLLFNYSQVLSCEDGSCHEGLLLARYLDV